MAKINVFLVADGDGVVQNSTILDIHGILNDEIVARIFDGNPTIVSGDDISESDVDPLRKICPSVSVITHGWLVANIAERLSKLGGDALCICIIASAATYRTILELSGDMTVCVVSPLLHNGDFKYRGWKLDSETEVYAVDGDEYRMVTYVHSGSLDVGQDEMTDEIDRLEMELSDTPESYTKEESAELDRISTEIIRGWQLSNALRGAIEDADDEADDDEEDDGDTICIDGFDGHSATISLANELSKSIDVLGQSQVQLSKQISDIYGSLKMISDLMLRTATRLNDTDARVDRIDKEIADTRRQVAAVSLGIAARTREAMDRYAAEQDKRCGRLRTIAMVNGIIAIAALIVAIL